MLENYKIILGSKSPRRKELLSGLNLDFSIKTIEVDDLYIGFCINKPYKHPNIPTNTTNNITTPNLDL